MIEVNQAKKLMKINTPKNKYKIIQLVNRCHINDDNDQNKLRKIYVAKYKCKLVQINLNNNKTTKG